MKIFDELELVIGNLVLLLQLVILVLQAPDSDLEQLVLPFALHRTVLVELVLRVLIVVLLLPRLDLPLLLPKNEEILTTTTKAEDSFGGRRRRSTSVKSTLRMTSTRGHHKG